MPLYRCTVIDENVSSKPLLTMLGIILRTYYSVHVEMYLQKAFSDMDLLSQSVHAFVILVDITRAPPFIFC